MPVRSNTRRYVRTPPPIVTGVPLDVDFRVVLPTQADVTNLMVNPSFELNTTSWAGTNGSTIAQSTLKQRRGAYSLQVTPSATTTAGVIGPVITLTAAQQYYFAFDFIGTPGLVYQYGWQSNPGFNNFGVRTFTTTGVWQRIVSRFMPSATFGYAPFIIKNNSANVQPYNLDGVQVINETPLFVAGVPFNAYPWLYFDGDSVGFIPTRQDFYWTGTPHGSTSVMIGQSRAAGRIVSLSSYGFIILALLGLGQTPLVNQELQNALLGGSVHQRGVKQPRTFDVMGHLSYDSRIQFERNLASLQAAVDIDAVTDQEMMFQYQPLEDDGVSSGGETFNIRAKYVSGLEGKRDNSYAENLDLKFRIYLPYVAALDGSQGTTLTISTTIGTGGIIQRNKSHVWSLPTGAGSVSADVLLRLPNGKIVVGGTFTSIGGVAANGIATYDPIAGTWSAMGTGSAGGGNTVLALVTDASGNLYAGGSFTSMGGVANTRFLAKWDGSVWSALGTGAQGGSSGVGALCIDNFGQLWAGGDFTTMGGASGSANFAVWSGPTGSPANTWSGPTSAVNNTVQTIVRMPGTNDLMIGGIFTQVGVTTVSGIATYPNATGNAVGTLAGGITSGGVQVLSLLYGPDGTLYAGGAFGAMGSIANTKGIAKWNGQAWSALSTGLHFSGTPIGQILAWDTQTNSLWVGGQFTSAGTLTLPSQGNVVRWTGSTWAYVDVIQTTTANVYSILFLGDGTVFMGSNLSSANWIGQATTTVTNGGTATTWPVITISNPTSATATAAVLPLTNITTGEVLNLNLSLQAGETVTINLQYGQKTIVSNQRGNLFGTLLPGSVLSTWHLQKGSNVINALVYVASGPAPTVTLSWAPLYNSIEAAIR